MTKQTLFQYLLLSLLAISKLNPLQAQSNEEPHSLYLLGNLEALSTNAPELAAIQKVLDAEQNDFTVLVNGDFVDGNGFGTSADPKDIAKMERLLELVKNKGKILFIPGDKEWDDGGKRGLKKVKALQDFLDTKSANAELIFPRSGCIGPKKIDIGQHLRIIAVNSQWFAQEHNRPEEEDTDCKILNEHEFWDELDDEFGDSDNRNIILAVHHTPISYGQYAGYKLLGKHFAPPIIGSVIASFHQNIGGAKGLNNQHLKHFSTELFKKTKKHSGLIIAGAHEYDIQLLQKEDNYYINSGALAKAKPVARGKETIFRQGKPGFVKLVFNNNGQVDFKVYDIAERKNISESHQEILFTSPCDTDNRAALKNTLYNPCKEKEIANATIPDLPKTGEAIAGKDYDTWFLQRWLLGKNYRSTWTTPILNIPYLDIDTSYGGLIPYAKGGAAQTTSLKFKSADGQRFAFRSVDKNPTRRMEADLAVSLFGKLSRDRTSHQHPYASIVVADLIDQLGLPSSSPKLYLMPDHPKLGIFREEFANTYGTLELKPKGTKKTDNAFRGATKVVSSFQMYRKLLDDNDHKLDVNNYVTARVFDIWIGDWDRHENNWKWLAYKEDGDYTYQPFPKDRDKAFSVLQGIYGIRMLKPLYLNKEDFAKRYGNLKYLNFKSRNMDRWLANTFTYDDWMAIAKKVQDTMTDEVIDAALAELPSEVHPLEAPRIRKILRARRKKLSKVIDDYYKMLMRDVYLVGTNSREYFEFTRLENGNVHAKIYNLKKNGDLGDQILDRIYKRSETKEINVYGLGKKDVFKILGESKKSILLRIIGGDGKDKIEDSSKVAGLRKFTKVYDKREKDEITMGSETRKMRTNEILKFESGTLYNYNDITFLPSSSYNKDDGFALGVSGTIKRHAFNKPDFSQFYRVRGSFTTKKNYNFSVDVQYRHVIKKWDAVAGLSIASRDKAMVHFYGYGNEIDLNDSLKSEGYYTNFSNSQSAYLGLRNRFWQKSTFTASLRFDFKDIKATPDESEAPSIYDLLPSNNGLGETTSIGPAFDFNLDFRDNAAFPTKGMQIKLSNYTFVNSDLDWEMGGRYSTEVSAFLTKGIKLPVTLALKGSFGQSYGDVPFYFQSYLGQQSNHRGFLKNRFGGDAVAAINTDLRLHFGKIVTPLVPIKYGIFGLYDVGRVWVDGENSEKLHYAYGGGVYLVPYLENFNLTFTYAKADGEDKLFSFKVGFFVR